MSTENLDSGGGGIEIFEGTRAAGCEPKAAVYIDLGRGEREVPIVSLSDDRFPALETHLRKGGTGTADIVRDSEVTVPLQDMNGKRVGPVHEILQRKSDRAPRVRIEIQAPDGSYSTVHDGFLRAAGPHKGNVAVDLTVGDWASLFKATAFSGTYGYDVDISVTQVIEDAVDAVAEAHDAVDDLAVEADVGRLYPDDAMERNATVDMVDGVPLVEDLYQVLTEQTIVSHKSFSRMEHSAADVLNWVASKISASWQVHWDPVEEQSTVFIDPTESGPLFVDVRADPAYSSLSESNPFEDPFEGRPIIVSESNAAWQLSPFHTLRGRGSTVQSEDAGSSKIREGKVRPVATVAHSTLRSMVGDNGSPPHEPVDAQTVEEVERETRQRLREEIREAAGGQMEASPEGGVTPGATVKAVPVCGGREVGDFDALRYSVEEVVHFIDPVHPDGGAGQRPSSTLIRCGLSVQDEDFETLEAEMMEV